VLAKVVETGVTDAVAYASTQMVELKEAMRLAGYLGDQGSAIATAKRLQRTWLHSDPLYHDGARWLLSSTAVLRRDVIATETSRHGRASTPRSAGERVGDDERRRQGELGLDTERQKAEFCKDVLALANTRVSGRRFLVIGFNNTSRAFTTSIDPSVDQHRMGDVCFQRIATPCTRTEYRQIAMDGGDSWSDRGSERSRRPTVHAKPG